MKLEYIIAIIIMPNRFIEKKSHTFHSGPIYVTVTLNKTHRNFLTFMLNRFKL